MISSNKLKILNVLLLTAIIINIAAYYSLGKEEKFNFDLNKMVPKKNGIWQSRDLPIGEYVLKGVNADSQVWRHYYDSNGNTIEIWIAFYKNQVKSTAHNPNTCYDGQGWVTEKRKESLILDDDRRLNMTRMFLRKDNNRSLCYYWYVPAGENAGTEFTKNLYKFYYGLLKNRRDLLFLRFSLDITDLDIEYKDKLIRSFIKSFFPLLIKELPASYFS